MEVIVERTGLGGERQKSGFFVPSSFPPETLYPIPPTPASMGVFPHSCLPTLEFPYTGALNLHKSLHLYSLVGVLVAGTLGVLVSSFTFNEFLKQNFFLLYYFLYIIYLSICLSICLFIVTTI